MIHIHEQFVIVCGLICVECMHTNLVGLEAAYILSSMGSKGAQWLSGRVLDSRPKGRGFEPHRHHCVVVLEQDTFILA